MISSVVPAEAPVDEAGVRHVASPSPPLEAGHGRGPCGWPPGCRAAAPTSSGGLACRLALVSGPQPTGFASGCASAGDRRARARPAPGARRREPDAQAPAHRNSSIGTSLGAWFSRGDSSPARARRRPSASAGGTLRQASAHAPRGAREIRGLRPSRTRLVLPQGQQQMGDPIRRGRPSGSADPHAPAVHPPAAGAAP